MDYFSAKINQLVIEGGGVKKSFVRSFISKPPQELEKRRGKLFGLIEIESSDQKISDLINLIIEEIKINYYSQKENADAKNPIETVFQSALQKVNLSIAAFLETKQINLDLEKINIIIGVIVGKELYFSYVGKLNIFLFQFLRKEEYRIIDIFETTKTPPTSPHPLKIFSQVISGKIGPRDTLFLTTPNLLDYFSLEKIKNIITGYQTTADGVFELKKILQNLNIKNNFAVIAFEIEKVVSPPTPPPTILRDFDYQKAAVSDSMKGLIKTEKETEKLLTPSILLEIKKYISTFKLVSQSYLTKLKNIFFAKTKKLPSLAKINFPRPKIVQKLNQGEKLLQTITYPIKEKFKNINFPKKVYIRFWQGIISSYKLLEKNKFFSSFATLPRSSKILLVISIILAILFLQSVVLLGIKNQREKRIERFNQIVFEAKSKKNEAEASLIYRDEDRARQLLIEIKNMLGELKPLSKTQKEQVVILINETEERLQKLRHLVNIEEPVLVVNFQNLDNQADIAKILLLAKNSVYTQNYNNQSIYKANLTSRIITGIFSADLQNIKFINGVTINDNELIFFTEDQQAFLLNPQSEAIQKLPINFPLDAEITDLSLFNNRLYLLSKRNNQIYRYDKAGSGYSSPKEWLKDSRANLKDTVSLLIDGSAYILENSGEIIKLENGKIVDFKTAVIEPPFKSPTKIKTTADSKYLYLLDPPTKRIIVLTKEGKLVNQYSSEKFTDLKDFIIIEKEKRIYILNGSAIYGFPVEHLK